VNAAAHVIASQPESLCPLLEYLIRWAPRQQWFHKAPLVPKDGFVELPARAGLGIELDEEKIEHQEVVSWP
jgi:L-alanine-DL-glutamate epimerase-like enolase superfamily enzyme